jgi:hypothetical protein
MPKPPLTRPSWWDADTARDLLRQRVAVTAGIGDLRVELTGEPLLRRDAGGGLLQSVRLRVSRPGTAGAAPRITRAGVTTGGGVPVHCEILAGPGNDTRVLVPEVDAPTELLIDLPELGEGARVAFQARPQRHWTLHLVQHSHLDIGYTDPQGRVMAEHRSYLDSLLDLCRDTDDWPEPARFRWAVEGFHSFQDWQAHRPRRRIQDFLDRVREGRIELTAMPFNLHTETCSTDELHELLRPVTELRDRHGIDISTAMQTDVPGQVVGLPDVLAGNGIRYLSVAHNWAGRAVPHLVGGEHLPRLFRWQAPSGSSVLVWRTDTPHGLAYMEGSILGFDESYDHVDDLLPAYLGALAAFPYPHQGRGIPGFPLLDHTPVADPYPWDVLHLRVLGKFADNGPPRRIISDTVRRWNEQWAFPQLRASRNQDFFEDAEKRVGDRLETYQGDWSDWWVDGVGAGAVPLAATRRGQAALAEAQTVSGYARLMGVPASTAVSAAAPAVYRAASLFNEHTWGAGDPWTHGDHGHGSGATQWHWKYAQALRAHDDAETLLDAAAALLGEAFAPAEGALASYYTVNTCSWPRTETARIFLAESVAAPGEPVRVLDARTGRDLPFAEEEQSNERHRAAGRFLNVPVDRVPACGTVRLDVVRAAPAPAADLAAGSAADSAGTAGADGAGDPAVLENDHLKVTVDLRHACIGSILDKATGRELVRQDAAVGFNGYLYDEYATAGGFNHQSSKTVADESMHLLASRRTAPPAALVDRTTDATGHTLVYECAPAGARRLRVRVHLPHGAARVDLENRLEKEATLTKESAFFAFPFALDDPAVRMEATGGVTGTGLATVPGSATHMRAVRRWISLGDSAHVAALATTDAPLVQLGNIAIPYVPYPRSLPREEPATVFSWVHNNIWDTNFPAEQAFDHVFRYSVAFAGAGEASGPVGGEQLAARTAAVTGHPLVTVRARADAGAEPPAELRFLTLDDSRVRLVGLTAPSEDTLLVRLQSLTGTPVTCRLTTPFAVSRAFRTTYLGLAPRELETEPGGVLPVEVPALGVAAVTLRLAPSTS